MELRKLDKDSLGLSLITVSQDEEFVFGRNPHSHITDCRVSRKHCKISFDDVEQNWILTPCSSNPTYIKRKGSNEWIVIQKSTNLKPSDEISLLQDSLIYECSIKSEKDSKEVTTAHDLEAKENLPDDSAKNDTERKYPEGSDDSAKNDTERKLPEWMLEEENASGGVPKKNSTKPRTEKNSRKNKKEEVVTSSPLQDVDTNIPSTSRHDVSNSDEEKEVAQPAPSTSVGHPTRRSCIYGSQCYRKNPQHKIDEAHPGDSDYQAPPSISGDEDDDRPECQYGVKCYRKNVQHRKEFKHTIDPDSKPKPRTRPKPRAPKRAKKSKSGDEGDAYESSFIDDESEFEDLTPDESDEEEWLPSSEEDD